MDNWSVYMLRNERGALYTGVTNDLQRRLAEHRSKGRRGARYTRGCATLDLVYRCELGSRSLALQAEVRIKRLGKLRKEALVAVAPKRQQLLEELDLQDSHDLERCP